MLKKDTREMAANAKLYEAYARFIDEKDRYETWDESVARVMNMHKKKYENILSNDLVEYMDIAEDAYKDKLILGAQRALQFGGEQILKHEMKIYNCLSGHANREKFFGEYMYLLLCGCGVGFSIQKHHVNQLPKLQNRTNHVVNFTIPDSIEGWAQAVDVLLSSYFETGGVHSKYSGKKVYFDFNEIRPKGSEISGGFKAPGPEPLRESLILIEDLLNEVLDKNNGILKPIHVYDISMHIADAVISGGVRRAATIALFSPDDKDMLSAKTGNWFVTNPQRRRSNNSVVLVRDETSKNDIDNILSFVKEFGEPGFVLTDNKEFTFNPCVEISMLPVTKDGRSGFQACNLTEINGGQCDTEEKFYKACEAASIMGTIQAGYTNFRFVGDETKEIVEREALLGVSVTGWMNNPDILFDENVMRTGAEIIKDTNRKVAKLLNINPAARTTCVKPSGNASVLLKTSSGIHGEHSPMYIRHIQMSKTTEVGNLIKEKFPAMIETSVWNSNGDDFCIAFPFVSPKNSKFKDELYGIKQLEFVKKAQQNWVEYGTNEELCTDRRLRHNVSNTIVVDDWDEIADYVYENKQWFAGISFLPLSGDKDYPQAPNAKVLTENELIKKYGSASFFASGLICQGLDSFDNDLWLACATALGNGLNIEEECHENALKRDFVNRFIKFSNKYFNGNNKLASECLKDVYYLHKWENIQLSIKDNDINWVEELKNKTFIDIDTMGSMACIGGACEI